MALELEHERIQYPIGQGFFHAAEVNVGSGTFRYIVDCGSTSVTMVDQQVDRYIDDLGSEEHIDALFLSHIDHDHVSGLDRLLGPTKVDAVFLPLLSPFARLALIAHAIEANHLTADLLSLLADPGRWFG